MHLLLSLLFLSVAAAAEAELARAPKWRRLLHYRETLRGVESEADGAAFFLSAAGKTDPGAELRETIRRFDEGELDDGHPICRFPLRYKWLNRMLGGRWTADLAKCPAYRAFTTKLAARRASVIFSSNYLTNPSSAFGHTLLRLSRFDEPRATELLDYGINYGARADAANPVAYLWNGVTGGFRGTFAATPYYYKIREYADLEFRDLWAYDLRLSPEEVGELVDHVWELAGTHLDYFYLRENCAYHILGLVNVVRPELPLTDGFTLYTVPAATLQMLRAHGLIADGVRRESTFSRLTRITAPLSGDERRRARALVAHPDHTGAELAGLDASSAARILDVAIEAYDYRNAPAVLREDPATLAHKFPLLRARALNPVVSGLGAGEAGTADPSRGHGPLRLTGSFRDYNGSASGLRFEVRPALHDLLDPEGGGLRNGALEMGTVSLEVLSAPSRRKTLLLDRLSLLSVRNYPPRSFWARPLAWELDAGARELRRPPCFNCPGAYVNGAVGASFLAGDLLGALLLSGELNLQSQFRENYRIGAGPKVFLHYLLHPRLVAGITSTYHLNTYRHRAPASDQDWESEAELRLHVTGGLSLFARAAGAERAREWPGVTEFGLRYFPR
jgi:hypothetical protein